MIGIIGSLLIVVCSVDSSNMAELTLPRYLSFPCLILNYTHHLNLKLN